MCHRTFVFTFRDAFPADDELARWVAVVSLISNDLHVLNHRLLETLTDDDASVAEDRSGESVILLLLLCSCLREAASVLRNYRNCTSLLRLLDGVTPESKESFCSFEKLVHQWENHPMSNKLKGLRDSFFHYPLPIVHEEKTSIVPVLEDLADQRGIVTTEPNHGGGYFRFAQDLRTNAAFTWLRGLPSDQEKQSLEDFLAQVQSIGEGFINCANEMVEHYLAEKGVCKPYETLESEQ